MFGPDELVAMIQIDVPINITDDLYVENTEIFNATLSTAHPHVMFSDDLATITILDNDGEPHLEQQNNKSSHSSFLQLQSQSLNRQCTEFLRTIVQFLCVLMLVWCCLSLLSLSSLQRARILPRLKASLF